MHPFDPLASNTVDEFAEGALVKEFGAANVSVTEHVSVWLAGSDGNATVSGLAAPVAEFVTPNDEVHVAVYDAIFVPFPVKKTLTAFTPDATAVTPVGAGGGKNTEFVPTGPLRL